MLQDRALKLIPSNSGQISIPQKHGWEKCHEDDASCLIKYVTLEVQVHEYNYKGNDDDDDDDKKLHIFQCNLSH